MFNNVLEFGLNQLKLHGIYWDIYDFGKSMSACYEKLNGVKEGLLSDTRKIPNEY